MLKETFKLTVNNWEFFISADTKEEAVQKVKDYVEKLFVKDGFSVHASDAQESLENGKFEIDHYTAFIVV